MDDDSDIWNAAEVAAHLQVHVETVRRLARRGEIPAFRVGKDWRFRRAAVERWVADQTARPRQGTQWLDDGDHLGGATRIHGESRQSRPPGREREHPEERVRAAEQRLRDIIEHSTNLFYTHTPDHVLTYVSPQSRQLLDCEPEEALVRWTEFVTDDPVNQKGFRLTERAIATGQAQPPYELQLRSKLGRIVWVEVREAPVVRDGRTVAIVGSLTDITTRKLAEEERKRVEQALATAARNYRDLFEVANDPIVIFEPGSETILEVNAMACQVYGFAKSEFVGMSLKSITKDVPRGEREVERILRDGGCRNFETQHLTKDGRTLDLLVSASPVEYAGKHAILSIHRDVTERRRLEAQLRQAQKMESVGRLAGGVAHDYNNMLGVILGFAELARSQLREDDPLRADIEEIQKAARRSADMTRQLLAFARKQAVAPVLLDLSETVRDTLKLLRQLIGENIELESKPAGVPLPVRMDPSQLDQILANLVVNARDAIAGVGRITIETGPATLDDAYCAGHPGAEPGRFALLTVSDTGCGMDPATVERVFEPFFTTKELGRGTGLGLATVYGIVKQNGGFIHVDSAPGRGTAITIYFPLEDAEAESPEAPARMAPPLGRGETVLVVEDEAAIASLMSRVLERLGYTVLVAATPTDAEALADRHAETLRLLITDVVMPEMNGRELANRLQVRHPGLRTLFISGYPADVIAQHGVLDAGVLFLQKPFTMESIASSVRAALDAELAA